MYHAIEITEEAEAELDESYYWYQDQSYGLGDRFLEAIQRCLEKIDQYPETFRVFYRSQRQAQVQGFPFIVLFEIRGTVILVHAVFHTRRDPRNKLR